MKYLYKLFDYVEFKCSNCNKKLLREFLCFLEERGYELSESAEVLSEFFETRYFREKTKTTQMNYRRDLKNFIEYVYQSEGNALYPSYLDEISTTQRRLKQLQRGEEGTEDEGEELDEEYKEFLRRYEELEAKQ